jgi:hypothetical protein
MLSVILSFLFIGIIVYIIRWFTSKKIIIEGLNTFNGRMAIDDQYFYDKLFDDVVYYPNEYQNDYNLGDLITTGWEKCKAECPGHCVEFGPSGNSYCFNY